MYILCHLNNLIESHHYSFEVLDKCNLLGAQTLVLLTLINELQFKTHEREKRGQDFLMDKDERDPVSQEQLGLELFQSLYSPYHPGQPFYSFILKMGGSSSLPENYRKRKVSFVSRKLRE